MSGRARAVLAVLALVACDVNDPGDLGAGRGDAEPTAIAQLERYATDPAFRRAALEASLVRSDNGYATLRLARYDEASWGALPELDVATATIDAPDAPPAPEDPRFATLDDAAVPWTEDALFALGERAFFNYPAKVAPTLATAIGTPDHAGVWQSDGRWGAVWARMPASGGSGARSLVLSAFSCATCHASVEGDRLVAGRNNAWLDAGRIAGDGRAGPRWGLGRVDVTADGREDPVAIPDLRPVRYQTHLHRAATLRNDPVALAIRIETLLITSHGEAVRPPRKIAAALAVYLRGLAPPRPLPGPGLGLDVFARACARCHEGEGTSGPPIALATVGTDPTVGESPERGTGMYRVPSLRSVGDRERLFASGAVDDVRALLAPERETPGHRYGMSLSDEERSALLVYLRAL